MSKSAKCSPEVTFVSVTVSMPDAISYFAEESSSSTTLPGRVRLTVSLRMHRDTVDNTGLSIE